MKDETISIEWGTRIIALKKDLVEPILPGPPVETWKNGNLRLCLTKGNYVAIYASKETGSFLSQGANPQEAIANLRVNMLQKA
jgi:hypothetical protein